MINVYSNEFFHFLLEKGDNLRALAVFHLRHGELAKWTSPNSSWFLGLSVNLPPGALSVVRADHGLGRGASPWKKGAISDFPTSQC